MDGSGDGDYLDPVSSLVTSTLVAVRSSFIGFVVAVGVVLVMVSVLLSGYVVKNVNYGMISGMTFIWGVSAFIYAVLGTVLLRLIGYS